MRPITARFGDWKVDVTATSAQRDQWGDLIEGSPRTIRNCLFAPTSSTDGRDLSDVTDDQAKLLAPPGADIRSTDVITVPGRGDYSVDGTPDQWPLGTAVQLTRAGGP